MKTPTRLDRNFIQALDLAERNLPDEVKDDFATWFLDFWTLCSSLDLEELESQQELEVEWANDERFAQIPTIKL